MRTRRLVPIALTCAAAVLCGCGGSNLLDGDTASELQDSLVSVRAAIEDGQCAEARKAAREGAQKVEELPSDVDAKLRARLREGFDALTSEVATDCREKTRTTPPPTTTPEPVPVDPVDPTPAPDPTPTPTTTTTTPTTTADPGPTDPTDPADPGDDDGSGGVDPGVDEGGTSGGAGAKEFQKQLQDARKRAENAAGERSAKK